MTNLSTAARDKLPAKAFAGPDRSYPIQDRAHASNAKARATQMLAAGRLTPEEAARINAAANRVLYGQHGNALAPMEKR